MRILPAHDDAAKPSSRQWVGVGILFATMLTLDLCNTPFPVLAGYLLAVLWAAFLPPAWGAGVLAAAGIAASVISLLLQGAEADWSKLSPVLLDRLFVLLPTALLVSRLVQERRNERRLSRQDPLTGLANRRFLQERLEEELNRSRRQQVPFSLIFLDCDGFKTVNDRLGHPAGDKLLQQLAGVLQQSVRNYDVVARWGGDEFLLLLPGTNRQQAEEVLRRLLPELQSVAASRIPLTFSAGVVTVDAAASPSSLSADPVVAKADEAMYEAKKEGGNRIHAVSIPP